MTEEETKDYTYDYIPTLEQLLPSNGGLPGVEYAIVATSNMRKAQDEGWERLAGNQKIFTVTGPQGEVDCELFGRGKPIKGADAQAGRRRCYVDGSVRDRTGHGRTAPKKDVKKSETKEE